MITITCDRCGVDITSDIWQSMEKAYIKGDVELQRKHNERLGTMLFHQEFSEFLDEEIAICKDCARKQIRTSQVKVVK